MLDLPKGSVQALKLVCKISSLGKVSLDESKHFYDMLEKFCILQKFCAACDEMFHKHPKRAFHVRKVDHLIMLFFLAILHLINFI